MHDHSKESDAEVLRQILTHVEQMDRRDKIRSWGSLVRVIITIVPLLIFLWSAWYAYANIDEIIQKITEESAKQATRYTQDQSTDFLNQLKSYIGN